MARPGLGMANVPLPRWPLDTSVIVEPALRQGSEDAEPAQPVGETKDDEQAALRQYAATLLNEASTEAVPAKTSVAKATQNDRLSPFTLAAMLLLAGCVFLVVIPPVGVTFLLCAVLPLIWGAGTAALGSS